MLDFLVAAGPMAAPDPAYQGAAAPAPLAMDRGDDGAGGGVSRTPAGAVVIWQGTTWDGCPRFLGCFSPVRALSTRCCSERECLLPSRHARACIPGLCCALGFGGAALRDAPCVFAAVLHVKGLGHHYEINRLEEWLLWQGRGHAGAAQRHGSQLPGRSAVRPWERGG